MFPFASVKIDVRNKSQIPGLGSLELIPSKFSDGEIITYFALFLVEHFCM